ncbi:MAG: Holliday junction branch migration protein RuvA [Acutalibacteraceae bacterium]
MFYSLTGKLVHMEPSVAVIECGGVAFKCLTSMHTQRSLPRIGETATLYTHLNVREDALDLFGFSSKNELNCFKMLTGISGVGPKVALAILSELSPEGVAVAAASGDSKSFTRASGVGPKLGQRIVLELKDKVKKMAGTSGDLQLTPAEAGAISASKNAEQAVQALIVLGYTQSEASQAVARLDSALATEELIRLALKGMSARFS